MIPQPPPGQGPIDPRHAFGQSAGAPQGFAAPQPAPMHAYQQPGPGGFQPQPQFIPGMMPPPPNFFAPQPPPRKGGAGRAILLTLLILGLLLSVFLNLVAFVGGGSEAGGPAQFTLSAGDFSTKLAVVPLRGIIEANAAAQFDQFLDVIEKDKTVKALVVEIDTPGGTVTASDEIYERLRRFKANKNIPIVITMGSMATSGGYYAACGGDYIFAQPTTITGNIGVLSPRFNVAKLMEKYGVEEKTIVATGSTFKNAGSSFAEETPEDRAYWQGLIDSAYNRFKTVVQQGRGTNLKGNMADIANGKAYTADESLALGLIDKIGYGDDAYAYAATAAGVKNPRVVRYERQAGLLDLLMSSKSNLGSPGASSTGGAVNVNLDAKLLEQLTTPRLLYLWTR